MAEILVVDDEVNTRELLRAALGRQGYGVTTVPGAEQALELISTKQFDLVILDVNLGKESGVSILKKIRQSQNAVPVIIYSEGINDTLENEAKSAGASEVLDKGADINQLPGQVERIIKASEPIVQSGPHRIEKEILVVDDDSGIRAMLSKFFSGKGYKVFEAENGQKAVELAGSHKFSVVLLDIDMPVMNGLETLKKLLEIDPKLSVVMVTGEEDVAKVKKAVELGAYNYVLKPFDFLYVQMVVASKMLTAEKD